MTARRAVRAIVADADPAARSLLSRELRASLRVDVVAQAADGPQAVAVAVRHRPDLALLAMDLPRMGGLAAARWVRMVGGPGTIVVVASAVATDAAPVETERAAAPVPGKVLASARLAETVLALVRGPEVSTLSEPAVRWRFPADPRSGSRARQRLRAQLSVWKLLCLHDDAELLATELVNNAVVHADSRVVVDVRRLRDSIRVRVTDTGAGTLIRRGADDEGTRGRGLMLVGAVASSWGTMVDGDTTTVWFELRTPSI